MTDQSRAQTAPASHAWLTTYPEGVDWAMTFAPKPVFTFLDEAVARFPGNICATFVGKSMTYRQVADMVNRAAGGLKQRGIGKGSKVGLFLPNSPTAIVYYFAILKTGATVVNFNPLYSLEELDFQARDSGTDIMITLDLAVLFPKVEALLKAGALKQAIVCSFPALLPGVKSMLFKLVKGKDLAKPKASPVADKIIYEADLLASGSTSFTPPAIDPYNDLAVLQYTGGTTGTPKGAMLTHANLHTNVMQVVNWAPELEPGKERVMGILPFFHVFAMTVVMNFGIARAAEIVLVPKFELNEGLKLINQTKPTVMPGVPTLFNAIMNHPQLKTYDLSSLKFCLSGGAPLPLEVKRGFEGLTGCKLVEGYGLSETSPVATANPLRGPVKESSIGIPVPNTIISIRSLDDPTQEAPLGEQGEICIKGPQVMQGYWNKPEETARVFLDDFLRTGDVGYMDSEGFTFIVDRIKDLILVSGYNVYPRRVEEAIYEFPAVEEVTVIGIAHSHKGEAPKAFVKLRKGHSASVAELTAFLEPKLSKLEMPVEIEFRDELPKTMVGKLSKKELKQEEAARKST